MKKITFIIPLSIIFFFACEKEPEIPTGQGNKIELAVSTDKVLRIDTTGFAEATVLSLGYLRNLNQHGHCWSTSPEPDTTNARTMLGAKVSKTSYTSSLFGLDQNKTYYVRAYISNTTHVAYGEEFVIKAVCGGQNEVIYGGVIYPIIAVGNQCWMAKNLNIGTFTTSTEEPYPHSNVSDNDIIEKYCYGNIEDNCDTYGGLYDWNEMMGYSQNEGAQGICPDGWHIPTAADWALLVKYLGGQETAGGLLKEHTPYNFNALMSGVRLSSGIFTDATLSTRFWTSSLNHKKLAMYKFISTNNDNIVSKPYNRNGAFHVRCIKN